MTKKLNGFLQKNKQMKSPIIIILLFTLIVANCTNKPIEAFECSKPDLSNTDFVYLESDSFKIHGKDFFPIMLNYVIAFRDADKEFIISPSMAYDNIGVYESNTKDSIYQQMTGHFQLIHELGFNTLRLTFDRISQNDNGKFFYGDNQKYSISDNYIEIFNALEHVLEIADNNNLRVMLLLKSPLDNDELEEFTIRLLKHFKDNPTLFAYDFMNEPLYFDPEKKRTKRDAYRIAMSWKKMMCQHAPNQLFTIGYSEPIEVFEWDQGILPVDFVQMHTYHPLRVLNEIYWYAKYVKKPFIIGETALPADNDSISYNEQRLFLKELYAHIVNSGAIGFGWWQFQDENAPTFEASYAGLLNHKGETYTSDKRHRISGSLKPAAKLIKTISNYKANVMQRPVNYYNMIGYKNICIKGTIVNETTNKAIEGALIRGWNDNWSVGMNTFSDENGNFTLYCNDPCNHFEISATGMNKIHFTRELSYTNISNKDLNINNLPNKDLEYHKIAYHNFIKNPQNRKLYKGEDAYIFNFDSSKFNKAKFTASLGTLHLKPVDFIQSTLR